MKDYTVFHQLDYDLAHIFIQVIRTLDTTYLKWKSENKDKPDD